MNANLPRAIQEVMYEEYAQEYLRNLPPEHFMEATAQATQREITLESLALLKSTRQDMYVFNELLIQYPIEGQRKPGQVVPDNMVVLSEKSPQATTSYNVILEPARPFWVLEYVSKHNKRKDYEDSFDKYERDLKIPYYLVFYPDTQDLTLYRHNNRKYITVKPNKNGRYAIKELDLELALLDGWVRYWHKGEMLPLPAELQRKLQDTLQQLAAEKRRADELQRELEEARRQLAELRSRNGKG